MPSTIQDLYQLIRPTIEPSTIIIGEQSIKYDETTNIFDEIIPAIKEISPALFSTSDCPALFTTSECSCLLRQPFIDLNATLIEGTLWLCRSTNKMEIRINYNEVTECLECSWKYEFTKFTSLDFNDTKDGDPSNPQTISFTCSINLNGVISRQVRLDSRISFETIWERLNEPTIKAHAQTLVKDTNMLDDIENEIKASKASKTSIFTFFSQPQQIDHFAAFKADYRDLYLKRSETWQSMLAITPPALSSPHEEYTGSRIVSMNQSDYEVRKKQEQILYKKKPHGFDHELFRQIMLSNPLQRWCSYFNNSQLTTTRLCPGPKPSIWTNEADKKELVVHNCISGANGHFFFQFIASEEAVSKFSIESQLPRQSLYPSDLFKEINDLSIKYTNEKSFLFSNQALNNQIDVEIKTKIALLLSHLAANGYSKDDLNPLKEQALDALDHLMGRTSCILHCH